MPASPMDVNATEWKAGRHVRAYQDRTLRPVEVMELVRWRDELAGRVLELGCGAGRVTGYLVEIARHLHAIDVSPAMVQACREAYPDATYDVRDLRDLGAFDDGSYDVVVAPFNVLSVLDDAERRRVLTELRRILAAGGLLLFSAHNRGFLPRLRPPAWIVSRDWRTVLDRVTHLPARLRNHRRLRDLQHDHAGYAIVNDDAHHFSLLNYYISRDAQERQLGDLGFTLLDCRDGEGGVVGPGADAPREVQLHYAARA
jgi:SAM-dependent methyltransferase